MDHWTDGDHEACRLCESLPALAEIAVSMLKRLKDESPEVEIHQICGPMTTGGFGNLELNMEVFKQAIIVARENGLVVFNQLPFQDAMIRLVEFHSRKDYPLEILHDFYLRIFTSGYLSCTLFLPLWGTSQGARWEQKTVSKIEGIRIDEYRLIWYKECLRRVALTAVV